MLVPNATIAAKRTLAGGRTAIPSQSSTRFTATTALVPPNAKALLVAARIGRARARPGVTSRPHAGSRSSILMVGGTMPRRIASITAINSSEPLVPSGQTAGSASVQRLLLSPFASRQIDDQLAKLVRVTRTFWMLGHFEPRIRSSTTEPWICASSIVLYVSEDCLIMVGLVSPRTISQPKPFRPDFRALTTSRRGGRSSSSTAGGGVLGRLAMHPSIPTLNDRCEC